MFQIRIENLKNSVGEYIDLKTKLFRLQAIDVLSMYLSSVMYIILICTLTLLVLIVSSIASALYLNELLGSNSLGYLLVAGFYLLITFVLILCRKFIVKKLLRDPIISQLAEITNGK